MKQEGDLKLRCETRQHIIIGNFFIGGSTTYYALAWKERDSMAKSDDYRNIEKMPAVPEYESSEFEPSIQQLEYEKARTYDLVSIGRSVHTRYATEDERQPVYVEDGSIITETKEMEAYKRYLVTIKNIRYVVVKNEKGQIAIYECPSD